MEAITTLLSILSTENDIQARVWNTEKDACEAESIDFALSMRMVNNAIEIRNIETPGNCGKGREIIQTIHQFADEHNFEVFASNVKSEARGFWEKMGYIESSTEGEYFRAG